MRDLQRFFKWRPKQELPNQKKIAPIILHAEDAERPVLRASSRRQRVDQSWHGVHRERPLRISASCLKLAPDLRLDREMLLQARDQVFRTDRLGEERITTEHSRAMPSLFCRNYGSQKNDRNALQFRVRSEL